MDTHVSTDKSTLTATYFCRGVSANSSPDRVTSAFPMLNGHEDGLFGRWHRMTEDEYGLKL